VLEAALAARAASLNRMVRYTLFKRLSERRLSGCFKRQLTTLSGQSCDRLVMPGSRFAAANTAHAEYQGLLERNLLYQWDWRCPPVVIHGVEVDYSPR